MRCFPATIRAISADPVTIPSATSVHSSPGPSPHAKLYAIVNPTPPTPATAPLIRTLCVRKRSWNRQLGSSRRLRDLYPYADLVQPGAPAALARALGQVLATRELA